MMHAIDRLIRQLLLISGAAKLGTLGLSLFFVATCSGRVPLGSGMWFSHGG